MEGPAGRIPMVRRRPAAWRMSNLPLPLPEPCYLPRRRYAGMDSQVPSRRLPGSGRPQPEQRARDQRTGWKPQRSRRLRVTTPPFAVRTGSCR